MVRDSIGLHHFHKRKKISKKLERYPSPNKLKKLLDRSIYVIGIAGPALTIPQLFKIWSAKSAAGVSLITWASYSILAFFWLIYGLLHREKPIILTYFSWLVVDLLVVLGVIIY